MGIWLLLSSPFPPSLRPGLARGADAAQGQWAPGGKNHVQAFGSKPHQERAAVAATQDMCRYAMGFPKRPWRERVCTYGTHLDAV